MKGDEVIGLLWWLVLIVSIGNYGFAVALRLTQYIMSH